jgi:hypothetical protein
MSRRPERVTIDMTVVIDLLEPDAERHADALQLLAMAEAGDVELGIAPQGHLHDNPDDRVQELRRRHPQVAFVELPQLAYPSEQTYPAPDLYVGNDDERLANAMPQVSMGENDAWHVETHAVAGRDVFITDDDRLKKRIKRLNSEHGIAINAMRLEEFVAARQR